MTRYVIDPPTLLVLAREQLRVDAAHQLVAPSSIRSQTLDLLLAAVRTGELTESAALKLHERLTEVKLRLLGDRVSRATAWRIARERDWDTVRLAEYLAVARLQADALVTEDPLLAAAAEGFVPLATLSDLLT